MGDETRGDGAQEARRAADYARLADAMLDALRPKNPIVSAPIVADGGTVNGTPQVVVALAGRARRAVYALPYPVRVGRLLFVQRTDPREALLVAVTSNYQVDPRGPLAATGTGSTLGVGATAAAAATDWAAGMADPTSAEYGERGASLPLILGRVADGV